MLRTHSAFFSLLRIVTDIAVVGSCWYAVYFLRFTLGLFSTPKGAPSMKHHLLLMLPVVCICYIGCLLAGLYKSKRVRNLVEQLSEIVKAGVLSGLLVLAFFYYTSENPYSRKLLLLFMGMLCVGLLFSHLLTMIFLRYWRKRGYNIRHYVVIGASQKGQMLVKDIDQMRWLGLKCLFFVDNDPKVINTELLGIPVYGPIEKLHELVRTESVDEVYLALGGNETQRIYPVLQSLQYAGITVRIIPYWGELVSMSNPAVVSIGSQLLFSSSDPALSGKKVVFKQAFDFIVAFVMLIAAAIPMSLIALLIKMCTIGPIFYKQTRIGMDQKEFEILKFRTMQIDAEFENEPQWSTANDSRCTTIGKFLRKTSLDELPQLINVLKGQMSLIGPRPERPHFVKQYSEEYRRYMLRHKVKSGMTGWAQIHGFRGDTSLRKRLVYDLYYVRNWSFGLDLWILLLTPWHVIKGENAH